MNHRKEGNLLYYSVYQDPNGSGKHYLWKIRQLTNAINCYEKGRNDASSSNQPSEWLKNTKSLAVVYHKLAEDKSFRSHHSYQWVSYNFKNALKYFCLTLSHSETIETEEWIANTVGKAISCMNALQSFVCDTFLTWQERCSMLEDCLAFASDDELGKSHYLLQVYINYLLVVELMKCIFRADNDAQPKLCYSFTEEINRPFSSSSELLNKYARNCPLLYRLTDEVVSLSKELEEIKKARLYYAMRSQALIHQHLGTELFNECFFQDEEMNIEKIWLCIDFFDSSLQYLALQDGSYSCYETAAKTCHYLGKLFSLSLCDSEKGHSLHLRVVQYCDIVTHSNGSTYFHIPWYQETKKAIEAYREKRAAFDAKEIENKRAPILEKIKPHLDAMEKVLGKSQSKQFQCYELIIYLYEAHPPKIPDSKPIQNLDKNDSKQMKKAAIKAISHYHPDKTDNKSNGMEWFVLCEEITKRLNNLFEVFKGVTSF